jgi:hypothetical protein
MRYNVHAAYFCVSLTEAQMYNTAHWNNLVTRDSPQRRCIQMDTYIMMTYSWVEKLWLNMHKWHKFHTVFCSVHVYQVTVYKSVHHYAHIYTVKLYSDMFR